MPSTAIARSRVMPGVGSASTRSTGWMSSTGSDSAMTPRDVSLVTPSTQSSTASGLDGGRQQAAKRDGDEHATRHSENNERPHPAFTDTAGGLRSRDLG